MVAGLGPMTNRMPPPCKRSSRPPARDQLYSLFRRAAASLARVRIEGASSDPLWEPDRGRRSLPEGRRPSTRLITLPIISGKMPWPSAAIWAGRPRTTWASPCSMADTIRRAARAEDTERKGRESEIANHACSFSGAPLKLALHGLPVRMSRERWSRRGYRPPKGQRAFPRRCRPARTCWCSTAAGEAPREATHRCDVGNASTATGPHLLANPEHGAQRGPPV